MGEGHTDLEKFGGVLVLSRFGSLILGEGVLEVSEAFDGLLLKVVE